MFHRVLVPLDESALAEQVLPHVVQAAHLGESTITLLRVVEPPTSAGVEQPTDPVEWQLALDRAHSYLVDVSRRLEEAGVRADIDVVEGDPATSILQAMRDRGTDLLIIATHGRGGMTGHSLGNVASKTVLRARTNLLLVRSLQAVGGDVTTLPEAARYATVLVPLDGSLRAESALAWASRFGDRDAGSLLLAHVVEGGSPMRRRLPDDDELEVRDAYRRSQRSSAEAYLALLERDQGGNGLSVTATVVSDGDAASAIDAMTAEHQVDLTVLTAHGESGSTRWPYGCVALHAVVYGATTLLIVQDRGPDELTETHTERAARERQGHG